MKKMSKLLWIALAVALVMSLSALSTSAAAEPATVEKTWDSTTTDVKAFLEEALTESTKDGGKTVEITLKKNMEFTGTYAIGTPELAKANGKIKITSELDTSSNAPLYGIVLKDKPIVTLYGDYELSNLKFDSSVATTYAANCLVFPDDSSVVVENISVTANANRANLCGNVTVKSGKIGWVAANAGQTGYAVSVVKIDITGTADLIGLMAGVMEGKGGGTITKPSEVTVTGSAKVGDIYASGRYSKELGTAGANILVNTDGAVNNVIGVYGPLSENVTFNIRLVKTGGTIGNVYAARMNAGGTAGNNQTVINLYIDGVTITNFYGGIYANYSDNGTNNAAIKGNVNICINKKEDLEGIEYPEKNATITNFYGGSNFSSKNSYDQATRTIEIHSDTSVKAFYGGSLLDVVGAKHYGTTQITIYGLAVTGTSNMYCGSNITSAATGAIHSGSIVTNFEGVDNRSDTKNFSMAGNARIVGGSYINNSTGVQSGETTINFVNSLLKATYPNNIHGGSYLEASGSKHTSKSTVNFIVDKADFTAYMYPNLYGGSAVVGDAIHSGDSRVFFDFKNTTNTKIVVGGSYKVENDTYYNHVYGGSYVQGTSSGLAAYHIGDSEVEFSSAKGYNFGDGDSIIYGGSRIYRAITAKPAGIGNPGDETYPKSKVILGNTLILQIRGGSRVEAAATVYQNSSLIFNGNGRTDENVAGGSEFLADNGKQVGNTELKIEGSASLRRDTNTTYDLYATGGITTTKAGVIHEGNALFEVNVSGTPHTTYGTIYQYGLIAAGGYNVSHLKGDITFNIKSGHIRMNKDQLLKAENQPITTAGIYGAGTLEGDITANLSGGYYYYATNASFYVGSYGTNVLEAPEGSSYPRGFRQVGGDITCNFSGGYSGDQIQLIGKNNDLDGNVYFNMSGTANGGYVNLRNGLAKPLNGTTAADYAFVITGDVISKVNGGFLCFGLCNGSPYSSTAIIEGNNIIEVSGGRLDRSEKRAAENNTVKFELSAYSTTKGTVLFKFVGNDFILDPVDPNGTLDNGMNINGLADNTFVLDLWRYTGDLDLVSACAVEDVLINPFLEGTVVGLDGITAETELPAGIDLSTKIPEKITVDGVEYNYADIIAFDELTDNDNAFVFYDADTSESFDILPIETKNIKLGVGDVKSALITFKPEFRISSAAVALKSGVSLVFKVKTEMLSKNGYTDPYVVITVEGDDPVTITEVTELEGGIIEFEFKNINPSMFGDNTAIVLYATKDDKLVNSYTANYNVETYCYSILASAEDVAVHPLLVDILNYGAAAQQYVANGTLTDEELVTYKLTPEQKALGSTYTVADDLYNGEVEVIDSASVTFSGASLVLGSNVQIMYKLEVVEGTEIDSLVAEVEVDGKKFTAPITLNGEQYVVLFENLTPDQFRETICVTIKDNGVAVSNTVSYSVEAYVNDKDEDSNTYLAALVKAIMNYGDTAEKYVA